MENYAYPTAQEPSPEVQIPSDLRGCTGGKHAEPAAEPVTACDDGNTLAHSFSTGKSTYKIVPAVLKLTGTGVVEEVRAGAKGEALEVGGLDNEGVDLLLEDLDGVLDLVAVLSDGREVARVVVAGL